MKSENRNKVAVLRHGMRKVRVAKKIEKNKDMIRVSSCKYSKKAVTLKAVTLKAAVLGELAEEQFAVTAPRSAD